MQLFIKRPFDCFGVSAFNKTKNYARFVSKLCAYDVGEPEQSSLAMAVHAFSVGVVLVGTD